MMNTGVRFNNFCNEIKISQQVADNVSYRYKRITRQINKSFWGSESEINHSLLVGSYGRKTAINASDVDTLLWLPYYYYQKYDSYQGNGQSALIQALRDSVKNTYATSHVKGDGQVVVIEFDDRVRFELLPCFENDDGSFTYPDSHNGGRWKNTNPRPEIEAIRIMDNRTNGNLKNLCRMMRCWKNEWNVPMGGILIDTLSYKFIASWQYNTESYSYYDWMVRDFLGYLKSLDPNVAYWLALGSNKHVDPEGDFRYKALRCYNIAVKACEYEAEGYYYSATQKWKEIFGVSFRG